MSATYRPNKPIWQHLRPVSASEGTRSYSEPEKSSWRTEILFQLEIDRTLTTLAVLFFFFFKTQNKRRCYGRMEHIYRRATIRNRMRLSTRNHGHSLGHHRLYCHGATKFSLDVDFTMHSNVSLHKMDAEIIPERKSKVATFPKAQCPD